MSTPTYKNYKILKQSQVRLVPPTSSYPDCVCELIMTERCLFVLEDEYNGTYTEHFAIQIKKIKDMSILTYTSEEEAGNGQSTQSTAAVIAELVVSAIAGIYVFSGGDGGKKMKQKYLRVNYLNEWGELQGIYFDDVDRTTKKLVNYWAKKMSGKKGDLLCYH